MKHGMKRRMEREAGGLITPIPVRSIIEGPVLIPDHHTHRHDEKSSRAMNGRSTRQGEGIRAFDETAMEHIRDMFNVVVAWYLRQNRHYEIA
jgi:hypothetical protein